MVAGVLFCVRSKFVARYVYEGLAPMASGLGYFYGAMTSGLSPRGDTAKRYLMLVCHQTLVFIFLRVRRESH